MNVASLLERTVERYPENEALVCGHRRWTYSQWNARINRLAQALHDRGVRPFDRIAIFLRTDEASVTTYFACQKLGAIAVPMNFRLATAELAHILTDSGAQTLVYGHDLLDVVAQASPLVPSLYNLIAVGCGEQAIAPGHTPYETLAEHGDGNGLPAYEPGPDHLSALVYTSGTTGQAKGVMHTHANDVAIATNCVMEYSLVASDRALHIAPLYHVGGMQAYFLPHLFVGAANVILPRYQALATLDAIEQERITTLFAVPTQIQEMILHPDFPRKDVSTLRMVTTGGAAIPATVMQRVLTRFCSNLFNGYGMTEASLTLLLHPRDALRKLGSCGKPTLISNARVIANDMTRDVKPDETVAAGEVGQLIVQGPQMMAGYWNNPRETQKKLRHGWLYTGDLFSRDQQGYFTFRGRMDDMIVSGGENIYPREIEEVLYQCPGVQQAAVIGVPDEKWGSLVAAFIVRADHSLDAVSVNNFFRDSKLIAAFKRPRLIVFVDALAVNPSGKVLKHELLDIYNNLPDPAQTTLDRGKNILR